jgi:hypothetical protein
MCLLKLLGITVPASHQYFRHEPLLEVAIKHWKENNLLIHTPSAATKRRLNKALNGIKEDQYGEAITTLQHIDSIFSSPAFS